MLSIRWAPVLLVFHTCLGDRRGLSIRCALPKANLTPDLGTLMYAHGLPHGPLEQYRDQVLLSSLRL